jgi:hypothetical protein
VCASCKSDLLIDFAINRHAGHELADESEDFDGKGRILAHASGPPVILTFKFIF